MAKVQPNSEQMSESYISIGLGLLVVVVVGILIYNYFTQKGSQKQKTDLENQANITEEATMSAKPGSTYIVQEGDTLWSISEKVYKTGYNWTDIALANNITSPESIEPGKSLIVPEATPILPITGVTSEQSEPTNASNAPNISITSSSYTVVYGDTLWSIACRAYGDCYAWVKIANGNNLVNPDIIHAGNVLNLPR